MKKRTWVVMLTVSAIACVVLAYLAVRSWNEYREAKENIKRIERIMEELEAREVQWKTEMEDWLDECERALMESKENEPSGVRIPVPYGPLPGLMKERMPR